MVEFAMTVVVFFMFIILGMDIIRFGYVSVTIQHVLSRAARNATVGTAGGNPNSNKTPEERADDLKQDIYTIGSQFGLDLHDATIHICPLGTNPGAPPSCSPDNAGTAKDFIKVRLQRPFPFVWGAWIYTVDQSVVAKNEPF
jgi:hypothetical protein